MKRHLSLIALTISAGMACAEVQACMPPEEPFVPSSDQAFSDYADIVALDFEQYFSELTPYFRCLDDTRQAAFDHAQDMSKKRDEFWTRADSLGLTEEVAVQLPEAEDGAGAHRQ